MVSDSPLQLIHPLAQGSMVRKLVAKLNKGSHDIHAHFHCPIRIEDGRSHDGAMFRENEGKSATPTPT